ncbi:MAG: hypothetical protein JW793_13500 [Acidobacteria bacterium]|nr:hypothetical protein [Acidobacteriota bacterium]
MLTGGISLLFSLLTLSAIALERTAASAGPQLPVATVQMSALVYVAIGIVFIAVFLIAVPGIFILVYQSRSVVKTVQEHDPGESWTDKCPLLLIAHGFFLCRR